MFCFIFTERYEHKYTRLGLTVRRLVGCDGSTNQLQDLHHPVVEVYYLSFLPSSCCTGVIWCNCVIPRVRAESWLDHYVRPTLILERWTVRWIERMRAGWSLVTCWIPMAKNLIPIVWKVEYGIRTVATRSRWPVPFGIVTVMGVE